MIDYPWLCKSEATRHPLPSRFLGRRRGSREAGGFNGSLLYKRPQSDLCSSMAGSLWLGTLVEAAKQRTGIGAAPTAVGGPETPRQWRARHGVWGDVRWGAQ